MSIAPVQERQADAADVADPAVPWITLVWNDPVNLMSYVTYVFQTYFGYSRDKATALMLDVHHRGRAVVATGPGPDEVVARHALVADAPSHLSLVMVDPEATKG